MSEAAASQAFLDRVSEWLAPGHPGAVATAVHSSGTDWAGDTESGFHSNFNVWIQFVSPDGRAGSVDVEGSDLESLWRFVVGGFGPIVETREDNRG